MSSPLLKSRTLAELKRAECQFDERLSFAKLPRLASLHLGDAEDQIIVTASLATNREPGGSHWPEFAAQVRCDIALECQRCMQAFSYELDTQFSVSLRRESATASPDPQDEVWEIGDERLRLTDVIEEYVLLALPLAPKHKSNCLDAVVNEVEEPETVAADTQQPFADLKAMLSGQDKN
ncbi:MAG: DUF177 domain-containing protein [Pseudomonadota bacterium]